MQVLHSAQLEALQRLGDWWTVSEHWRRLALREPAALMPAANCANALWLADRPGEALVWAERASRLAPDHPVVWRGLGNVLQDLGQFEASDQAYGRSQALQADPATAFNHSKTLLGLERYPEAYTLAEQRFNKPGFRWHRPGPYWQERAGAPIRDPIAVWSEQGFGDVIQHLRWLVPLLQAGRVVELELEAPLVDLAQQGLAWAGGALRVRERPRAEEAEPADRTTAACCHGSLLSLPHWLGQAPLLDGFALDATGARQGYLRLPAAPLTPLQQRRPRLGLVWASGAFRDGHVLEREYRRKSLPLPALQALLNGLALRPIELVNLQVGADRHTLPAWIGAFAAELPEGADFATEGEWMQGLDLVLSVDTAAAHLAGALGRPVWTLLPWAADPRWLRERSDSPWYPTMRLIRQPAHQDWCGLVGRVLARLDLWLSTWPGL